MVKSSKGFRSRTRYVMKKKVREKGMPSVSRYLQTFEIGSKVIINIDPSVMKGMPHPRYQGRVATVVGKQGFSYKVEFLDGKKKKRIISYPVHLRLYQDTTV